MLPVPQYCYAENYPNFTAFHCATFLNLFFTKTITDKITIINPTKKPIEDTRPIKPAHIRHGPSSPPGQ
jgi:hypothetical protein